MLTLILYYSVSVAADDWLGINAADLSRGPPTYHVNDAWASCGWPSVSLHIISILEALPSAKVYLHCHNAIQLVCMKYEMKREKNGNLFNAWFQKGTLLYAGRVNQNTDKRVFLSSPWAHYAFVWFLVAGHSVGCNYAQRNFRLRNKQLPNEVATNSSLIVAPRAAFIVVYSMTLVCFFGSTDLILTQSLTSQITSVLHVQYHVQKEIKKSVSEHLLMERYAKELMDSLH